MFRFANPQNLYILIAVLAVWVIFIYGEYNRRKRLDRFGLRSVIEPLMPEVSKYRPRLKFFLQQLVLILLVFVLARPQKGSKVDTIIKDSVEIEIALDVSNSMNATDVLPSRLEKAKMILSKLVGELENDKIGLIVFAGEAYTQVPITTDLSSAKMIISSIKTDIVPSQGTSIANAIDMASNSFTQDENTDKAIILITDAEDHEENAISAAKLAVQQNRKVHVIGVGSTEGGAIPLNNSGRYLKDREGNVVITRLNESLGKEIASAGNGIYVTANNTNNALKTIVSEVKKMKGSENEEKIYSEYDEQYRILAIIAFILLLIDSFILNGKSKFTKRINFFTE